MNKFNFKTSLIVVLVGLSFAITSVHAATGVGKAIISIGKVSTTSKDGTEKKLKRRGKVFEGDTITVGAKSRLQLRFVDNQLVVLKANTVFRIDEYKFKDKNDKNKSAALSLLKGGMRSVTGLIGKSARDKYKVRTPVATMGVRGTHYVLQICNSDCGDGVKGLVGTVLEGEIEMTNDGGTSTFGTDQFFNVPSSDDAPKTMTNPPAVLVSKAETKSSEEEESNSGGDEGEGEDTAALEEGSSDEPADDSTTDSTTDTSTTTDTTFTSGEQSTVETTTGTISPTSPFYTGTAAPAGAIGVFGGIAGATADGAGAGGAVSVQGSNGVLNLETVNGVPNQLVNTSNTGSFGTTSFQVNLGAVATEQGEDPFLGINWGRWDANDVVLNDDFGNDLSLLTGLSFVYSDNPTPDSTVVSLVTAGVGQLFFDLIDGPFIRDESGGLVSGGLTVVIDFGTSGMATPAVVGFIGSLSGADGRDYNNFALVNSVDLIDLQAGTELMITADCLNGTCLSLTELTGTAGGALVGPNADALIGYFGLNDATGTIGISGAGVFVDLGGQ